MTKIKKKNNNFLILIIGMIIILSLPKGGDDSIPIGVGVPVEPLIEGGWDISKEVQDMGYEEYLIEEEDFDYSNPLIFNVAQKIKQSTSTPDQAIKQVAKFVVQNVDYTSVSVSHCYNEKASDVAESGMGDCVSMARLVLSLLRAQGIPARTMGGCLSLTKRCDILFAAVPLLEPRVSPMVEGDFKKRGFLHEWVEVWTPQKGWIIVEATAGRIYPQDCVSFLKYDYDYDRFSRCVIKDLTFWQECKVY